MRKSLRFVLVGLGATTLAGAALAAGRDTHVMTVALPDGSSARVEYVGKIAPKVTILPAPVATMYAPFGLFDRSALDMQRQIDAMMRQIQSVAQAPAAGPAGMNVAAYGSSPMTGSSVTVISTSNGAKTCTRTTEVTAQGAGKPPKVVTKVSGDCSGEAGTAAEKPTA